MFNLMARMLNWEASRPKYRAGEIVDRMELSEGDAVADVGSGGGFFTYLFSETVGGSGAVYAVDTSRSNLAFIEAEAARKGLMNVKTVFADRELELPEGGIDRVFLRNVFHHLKEPASYFNGIGKFLKPDGKIVIIEHTEKTKGGFVGFFGHHTPEKDVVGTLTQAGFELKKTSDFLPAQSFLVFEVSHGR